MKILNILLVAAGTHAATAPRAPLAGLAFDMVPGEGHPALSAELAWLDQGRATGVVSTGPEAEAILSAPHFQVVFAHRNETLVDAFRPDSALDEEGTTTLRLGTALALSQMGLGTEGLDLALGAAYQRDRVRHETSPVSGSRQWVDLSLAARIGTWRLGVSGEELVEIASDSGLPRDRRIELEIGRKWDDGLAWGAGLDLPLDAGGEFGLRGGVSREFRQALEFRGALATSYAKGEDPSDGARRLVRRSLELRLGTRVKFRPWVSADDPRWMRGVVDPAWDVSSGGFLLRGWEIGVSAGWDMVTGQAKPAVDLTRSF
jgi:hypothetical protein